MSNQCPLCLEGLLYYTVERDIVNYRGTKRILPLHYFECTSCGVGIADASQVKRNEEAMLAFQERIDRQLEVESCKPKPKMTTLWDFESNWDSLNPFAKVNWRDFTFIKIGVEFCNDSNGHLRFKELHLALLGLHLFVHRYEQTIYEQLKWW